MSFKVDFSGIKTVRVHKQQYDAINKKADIIMIVCKEDGRVIAFNRAEKELEKQMPEKPVDN